MFTEDLKYILRGTASLIWAQSTHYFSTRQQNPVCYKTMFCSMFRFIALTVSDLKSESAANKVFNKGHRFVQAQL